MAVVICLENVFLCFTSPPLASPVLFLYLTGRTITDVIFSINEQARRSDDFVDILYLCPLDTFLPSF